MTTAFADPTIQRKPQHLDVQSLSDRGKEKLPFHRKKPPADPVSWRGSHLPQLAGVS